MNAVYDDIAILEQAKQGHGELTYRTDVRVQFYLHATKDEIASRTNKRPIYKDAVYMSTHAAGVKDFTSRPAKPEDIASHPREWAEFRERMDNKRTSIKHLPKATPAVLLTLEELGLFSIEDFAASSPTPELAESHAIACRWVEAASAEPAKRKGGWPKGKPRKGHGEDAQAAA